MQSVKPPPTVVRRYRRTRAIARAKHVSSGTERILGLSDAVFAVAMTLLVAGIQAPNRDAVSPAQLPQYVIDLRPSFQAWIISFLVIGSFWIEHHHLFRVLNGHDSQLLWLNLLFLLPVSFLPFPTLLIRTYADSRFAVIFYAADLFAAATLLTLMALYAGKQKDLVRRDVPKTELRSTTLRGVTVQSVCLLSVAIAFVSVPWTIASWFLIPVVQFGQRARAVGREPALTVEPMIQPQQRQSRQS